MRKIILTNIFLVLFLGVIFFLPMSGISYGTEDEEQSNTEDGKFIAAKSRKEAARMAEEAYSCALEELKKESGGAQAASYCKVFKRYNKIARLPEPLNYKKVKYQANIKAAKFYNQKVKEAYDYGNTLAGDTLTEKALEYLAEAAK